MQLVEAKNGGRHRGMRGIACPGLLLIGMSQHDNPLVVLKGSLNLVHLIMGWFLLAGEMTGNVGRGDKEVVFLQMSERFLQEAIGGTVVPRGDQLGGAYSMLCSTGQVVGNMIGCSPPEPKGTHHIKRINHSHQRAF